ncbi:MAG TPA: hypothetical protein ENN80_08090, partial [Candidatus Hydrogenedentes bacterium]|nr:hypothetical protein [Candidatus Hydrogenedentota bacterium]
MSRKTAIRETDLYPPVRDFLVANGYTVRGEVNDCDVTASKGDDLIVIELKRRFGVELLYQATERQRVSDSVYVALPAPDDMGRSKRWRGMTRVLRQLELGLIVVFLSSRPPRVEIVFHPLPCERRKRARERRAVLEEMGQRSGDYNQGGSTRRTIITAYRENAIHIACCLAQLGPLEPRQLRVLGTGPKTTAILYNNFYGWFERVGRSLYTVSAAGRAALDAYPELAARFNRDIPQAASEKRDS